MKKSLNVLLLTATCGLLAAGSAHAFDDEVRQALQLAAEDVRAQLQASALPRTQTVSVLPLGGDQGGYLEGLLKIAVTSAGLNYVEARQDPFWNEIMAEVEWDERKSDMLDAATISRFGKLKSTQLLLYGNLRAARQEGQRVFVEIELHLSSIETKEHLWGTVVSRRFYQPGPIEGIIALDPEVRAVLNETIARGLASLKAAPKLSGIGTVVVVPLAGDIDRYVTQRVIDMVSRTHMNPRNLDVATLGEARQLLRDRPEQGDAVLYGAVRDLSMRELRRELMKTTYEISAEVQLTLQSATTGEILWSDTVEQVGEKVVTQTGEEKVLGLFRSNPRIWWYLGAIVVAVVLIGKMTRVK